MTERLIHKNNKKIHNNHQDILYFHYFRMNFTFKKKTKNNSQHGAIISDRAYQLPEL